MSSISPTLQTHRSIRKYKPEPIDRALVEEVIGEAIAGSSSSGNLNSVSMVLSSVEERRKKLYQLHHEQEMILQAPLVITFCADWYRTREWLRLRGAKDNFNNMVGFLVAMDDAMILAQSVCLGFQARGLGICYMGTTLFNLRAIADFLELPETCLPATTIVVGYPDEDPPKRDRLPLSAWIHEETYRLPSEEEINQVYMEREVKGWERYMSYPGMRELAEEKGITTLAQFYTSEIKYDPDFFAEKSVEILELMKERGFLR